MLRCPHCTKNLDEIALPGARVDRCALCGGLWFDRDELAAVKDERDAGLGWLEFDLWSDEEKLKAGGTFIDCPRDGNPLFRIQYGPADVMVDVCLACRGVWLDKDELEKILSALRERVKRETLPEYLRDLEEELKDLFLAPEHSKEDLRNIAIIMKLMEYRLGAQHPKLAELISELPD